MAPTRCFIGRASRASMDEIAAGAGVIKRTRYAHYDSKDALLADVLEHHHQLAHARLSPLLDAVFRR